MSGGTCEATAYQLYGYRSAALCVALGNYHNCGPDITIAPEFVSVEDVHGMVRLLVAAATMPASSDPITELREKLEKGLEKYSALLLRVTAPGKASPVLPKAVPRK